ncbi:hypothetical protein [Rhodococcus qingshengii]|uniref:hypothetical protein n=1 Tax=Rhodococcus TaxID=1827 RepID=UPI001BB08EF3|nr:hypothetical protein [Rhodococcus qingshengii]MBS3695666.1 hypothetical protein [Rhodococcus qingshengii]
MRGDHTQDGSGQIVAAFGGGNDKHDPPHADRTIRAGWSLESSDPSMTSGHDFALVFGRAAC